MTTDNYENCLKKCCKMDNVKNRWIINKYSKWINRQVKHGDNLPSSQRVPPRLRQTCCYDIGASKRLVPCQQSWPVHNAILQSDSLKRVQCLENNKSLPRKQYMTAEIPITSTNTIKSNHYNFKRFDFHWLCCLNRSVWSQEQVHSTSGFTSGCHTFAFLEGVTWESPRSQQGPPPTLKVAKTSKHVAIVPHAPAFPS